MTEAGIVGIDHDAPSIEKLQARIRELELINKQLSTENVKMRLGFQNAQKYIDSLRHAIEQSKGSA